MNLLASPAAGRVDGYYPSSDGQPVAETEIHLLLILNTLAALRHFFRKRRDVYVAGNMFLYYKRGDPSGRRAPDIMVVKGVDARVKRRSFKTWEEKAVPRTVVEYTSKETADEDLGPKKELYQTLKVREYFLFDPLHEYLPRPLLGYRLAGDQFEELPAAADGSLISAELGLRLCPEGTNLGLYNARTGEKLLPMQEALELLEETKKKLKAEKRKLSRLQADLARRRQPRKGKQSR